MSAHVLAIDQGTTGNTAVVIDREGRVVGRAAREYRQIFPQPGWVEHDPEDIWSGVLAVIGEALASAAIAGRDIAAIGITNQRETSLLWERATGHPVANALVWQDRRTADRCAELKRQGREADVRRKTGLLLDPYFSATKLEWLLQADPERARRAAAGELAWGTVDSFLLWRLTDGAVHATEPSNASRTLLFNIDQGNWDDELCALFGVPRDVLPELRPSSGVFGTTRGLDVLPDGIPIAGIAGDQQAALFGQACFEPGLSKCTYGTGAFLLLNTGTRRVDSSFGILTTVAWRDRAGAPLVYAMEGSSFIAGAAVQWLRDGLGLITKASEIEALAASVASTEGVHFVPALTGLGAPHWRAEARGVIHGLTRGTTKAHVARATLEGIALQIADLIGAMNADAQTPIQELRVDGGAAANDLLMQMQADFAQVPIVRPVNVETTAFGAGYLAGLGVGLWPDTSALQAAWQIDRRFEPQLSTADAKARRDAWAAVVAKA